MPEKLSPDPRSRLRHTLKQKRSRLADSQVERLSRAIADRVWNSRLLSRKQRIAVYLAIPGEVDCKRIIRSARLRKMRIFVPVLFHRKLIFAPLDIGATLTRNRFGVAEPVTSRRRLVNARNLDAVIVPLLGFDANANRIGMGGGYYDRTFAFRRNRRQWRHPLLIGVGYSFQQVDAIPVEAWDVPLDFVVTEQELLENR